MLVVNQLKEKQKASALFKKSLFIFRRDLRLQDNTALIAALKNSESVIPCFVLDPRQIKNHPYKSEKAFQFMLESLMDLDDQLKKKGTPLSVFEGLPYEIIEQLITKEKIEAIYVNWDYTPFSQKRDQQIKIVCKKKNVEFIQLHDALLHAPDAIRKVDGGFYTIYTPYMRNALSQDIPTPAANRLGNYFSGKFNGMKTIALNKYQDTSSSSHIKGGRKNCLKILKKLGDFKNYDQERNIPALDATTHLSAHNKFGTCSVREVFYAICRDFNPEHTLIKELVWRDFFTQIGYNFPHVLGNAFNKKYANIKWDNDKKKLNAWCDGLTGFPIVDAGMRELNETGFMHNRVRMITASFLVKDLRVDWRWGEKYFAQKLVDYDPFVNNGNWQWAASTGCDAQPYFRIFNPWLQQERYDPDCIYIKKWIPELKNIPAKTVHKIVKEPLENTRYPEPIIDHKQESAKTLSIFKNC